MDEQHRSVAGSQRSRRRRQPQIPMVTNPGIHQTALHDRPEKMMLDARELLQPVVGNLAKAGERRVRHYGVETSFVSQRLQQNGASQRHPESVNALWMACCEQPIHPSADVSGFVNSVRDDRAPALSVSAGIGHQDSESVPQQESGVAE